MEFKQKKLTISDVQWSTDRAKDYINHYSKMALQLLCDDEKKMRQAKALCPRCFYNDSRIGGAAMTKTNCSLCEKDLHFSNTNTDTLCETCALGKGLCKHCGAAINLKISRGLTL